MADTEAQAKYKAQFANTPQATTGLTANLPGQKPTQTIAKTEYMRNFEPKYQQSTAEKLVGKVVSLGDKVTPEVIKQGKGLYYGAESAFRTITPQGRSVDFQRQKITEDATKAIDAKQSQIVKDYGAGKISPDDYAQWMRDLSDAQFKLGQNSKQLAAGPSPGERAMDTVDLAVTLLSFGSLKLTEVAGKQAFKVGSREGIAALVDQAATTFEKVMFKVPGIKKLVAHNLEKAAVEYGIKSVGETGVDWTLRNIRKTAVALLLKKPLIYQQNIGDAKDLYAGMVTQNYSQAASAAGWLSLNLVAGGLLGAGDYLFGKQSGKLAELALGKGSVLDRISEHIGFNVGKYLVELPEGSKKVSEINRTRLVQEILLKSADNDTVRAFENFVSTTDPSQWSHLDGVQRWEKIMTDWEHWRNADVRLQQEARRLVKLGVMTPEEAKNLVVVIWNQNQRSAVANARTWEDVLEMAKNPLASWANHEKMMLDLKKVFDELPGARNAEARSKAIMSRITAYDNVPKAFGSKAAHDISKLGYTVAFPVHGRTVPFVNDIGETRKIVTAAVKGSTEYFDETMDANPIFSSIAHFMAGIGLSPVEQSKYANRIVSESFMDALHGTSAAKKLGLEGSGDLVAGGRQTLALLQDYIEKLAPAKILGVSLGKLSNEKSAVTDVRQLTIKDFMKALNITEAEAKEVRSAVMNAYHTVPLELRGLGDRGVDLLYRYNPLHKYYSRAQSALRYTYNPFFRVQEIAETKILSHAQADNLIWDTTSTKEDREQVAELMKEARTFTGTLSGQAAEQQVVGRLTASLTKGQERDLAGLAIDMAQKKGIPIEQMDKFLYDYAEEVDDLLRVVIQYPQKGVLASPLSRTINQIFFPMAYNAKVSMLAAQVLQRQPAVIQKAVLHSGFQLAGWLNSDEGIKWRQENVGALQVLSWLTPINSISAVMNILRGPESWADLGTLGGLPVGFITQILDGQGIIHLNRPYVNPRTGDVIPDYIPQSVRSRAAQALSDILNSMFSYPGRVLGLPGKKASLQQFSSFVTRTDKSEYKASDEKIDYSRLTKNQKNYIRVIKGKATKEEVDALYTNAAPGKFNWYTLPPPIPIKVVAPIKSTPRLVKRTGLPSKKKGPAAKKPKTLAIPLPR